MTGQTASADERSEPRQDVLHRARMTGQAGARQVTIVNISPHGLMVRTADAYAPGDHVTIDLPFVGAVAAEVRWALGGRIGCRLGRAISLADYRHVLQAIGRG